MSDLTIKVEELGGGMTLMFPRGDIDSDTYFNLIDALETAMERVPRSILIDMRHVPYISSVGLGVVFEAMKKMKAHKGELVLCNLQATTRRVFELVKVFPPNQFLLNIEEAKEYVNELLGKNSLLQPDIR